jgi:uncharacterized membrane protein YkoI
MIKSATLFATLVAGVCAFGAQAAPLQGAAQVQQKLAGAGYTQVLELELDDGMWEADVTRADGRFAEVLVDPRSGEIFDEYDGRPLLGTAELLARAAGHGLHDITEIERDGATWVIEARNARNQRVEVRLGGVDGRILHSEREGWLD